MLSVTELEEKVNSPLDVCEPENPQAFLFLETLCTSLANEISLCGFCARIGLQNSPDQLVNQKKILAYESDGLTVETALLMVQKEIQGYNDILSKSLALRLFSLAYPIVAYVLPTKVRMKSFQPLTRFCRDFVQRYDISFEFKHFLADERIGCQIDCAPESTNVRRDAQFAMKLNVGYKKKASQRQKEKQLKKAEKAKEAASSSLAIDFKKVAAELSNTTVQEKISIFEHIFEGASSRLHNSVRTVALLLEALKLDASDSNQIIFKNLFLRGKEKGTGERKFFLVSVPHTYELNFKTLTKLVQQKFDLKIKSDLRQTTEDEVKELLKVSPGEVSPLCLLYKPDLYFISHVSSLNHDKTVWIHPLTNEATMGVDGTLLLRFVKAALPADRLCLLD